MNIDFIQVTSDHFKKRIENWAYLREKVMNVQMRDVLSISKKKIVGFKFK